MKTTVLVFALAAVVAVSLVPAVSAVGECYTFNVTEAGEQKLDGPALKNCSRCQWQCLTDSWCTHAQYNGVRYNKTDLVTLDCGLVDGDDYFTMLKNGTIKGLCVMFNAAGQLIDTQEQSCEECAQQCYYWGSCTGYTFNYNLTVAKDNTNSMLSSCPLTPFSSPLIIQPDGNARRLK